MPLHSKSQAKIHTVWHLWVCSYWGVLELIFKRDGHYGKGEQGWEHIMKLIC